MIRLFFFCLCSFSFYSFAGGQEGGGGGYVHDTFIKKGKEILYFLKEEESGRRITEKYNLNLCRLRETLNENLIFVYSQEQMLDHRGSIVDAYAYPWRIYLFEKNWEKYFRGNINVSQLILKEMLRSENTYFHQAIDISTEIKSYEVKTNPAKWDAFIQWFDQKEKTCLTDDDFELINEVLETHRLSSDYIAPTCEENLPELHFDKKAPADILLDSARTTQCRVKASKCSVKNIITKQTDKVVLSRVIHWQGRAIYGVPISIKTISTGEKISHPFPELINELTEMKLADLAAAGICEDKEKKSSFEVPGHLEVKDLSSHNGGFKYEYLREDGFLEGSIYNIKGLSVLASGAKVQLVSRESISEPVFGAQFVKVRVIENNSNELQGEHLAPPGSEGWITLTSTNYTHYHNQDFQMIIER